jgi:hypothetical protein
MHLRFTSFTLCLLLALAAHAAAVPSIVGLDTLNSWRAGVAQADAGTKPLTVACFGDSNTEAATYTVALRQILQSCYGDHGTGYQTLCKLRGATPGGPEVSFTGTWQSFDTSPGRETPPPAPYYALDGFWSATEDPNAAVQVTYPAQPGGALARVRVHYQVGPGLGAFSIVTGTWERQRINCAAEKPGYAVTDSFLTDRFAIKKITGKVVLLGADADRQRYDKGVQRNPGGALVHAFGNGWGMAAHLAPTDEGAFRAAFAALKPDLITVMFGTNDIHNDGRPARYRESLTAVVQKLRAAAPGTGILLLACPEAGQTRPGAAREFAGIARDVAAAQGCAFWDWGSLLGPHSRPAEMQGWMGDGLHYNSLGGSVLAHLLLRGLSFDLNDLTHWPVLNHAPEPEGRLAITVPRIAPAALAADLPKATAYATWHLDRKAAEMRFAVCGDALVVQAHVFDGRCTADAAEWPGSNLDIYVSAVGSSAGDDEQRGYHGITRQLVFFPRGKDGPALTAHENGKGVEAPKVVWTATPRAEGGYDLQAQVPLAFFRLDAAATQFYLEAAVVTAPGPGAPVAFTRVFERVPSGGAFRDNTQSAAVTVR